MQYILTEQEYKALSTDMQDHKQFMWLIDVMYQINSIPNSAKRCNVLESVTNKLSMFHQSGNSLFLDEINEELEVEREQY